MGRSLIFVYADDVVDDDSLHCIHRILKYFLVKRFILLLFLSNNEFLCRCHILYLYKVNFIWTRNFLVFIKRADYWTSNDEIFSVGFESVSLNTYITFSLYIFLIISTSTRRYVALLYGVAAMRQHSLACLLIYFYFLIFLMHNIKPYRVFYCIFMSTLHTYIFIQNYL